MRSRRGSSPPVPLFSIRGDYEASLAAAVAIIPNTGTLRRVVLDWITARGALGATDEEIQRALRMNPSTQRPRRIELVEAGLVRDSEKKRKTDSGRNAVVWIAAEVAP